MEERFSSLPRREIERLMVEGGFTTTHDTSLDHAVRKGRLVELLDSYGRTTRVKITQKEPRFLQLGSERIKHFDIAYVVIGDEKGTEYTFNSSMSDCYHTGWRFLNRQR